MYVRSLPFTYEANEADRYNTYFTIVELRNDSVWVKADGKQFMLRYRQKTHVNEGQVISINHKNELQMVYKKRHIQTLDELLPSINVKGHKPYYIEQALANGYVLQDLDGLRHFENVEGDVSQNSLIILNENNECTFVNKAGDLFKKSSFYKGKQRASVSLIDENIFVLKENEEYVSLKGVPSTLQLELGDVVYMDEDNQFIERIEVEHKLTTTTIEQKLRESGQKVTKKEKSKGKQMKHASLLIIGNVRISERYKKYFGELGYVVNVVDGTGPFEKIKQACNEKDYILYSTAFTSHKNSGKMRAEVNKPYILCDSTSPLAMRIALEQQIK